ncbi:MAG: serine/threonine-protein kinase [Myxococcota bacterium]
MEDEGLALQDVLDDLRQIIEVVLEREGAEGAASYDAVQQALSDHLHLHILSYIRFLENQDYVVYDRIRDEISVQDTALDALDSAATWRDEARVAFGEHIDESVDSEEFEDVIDDVGEDLIDDIATGVEDSFDNDNDEPTKRSTSRFQDDDSAQTNVAPADAADAASYDDSFDAEKQPDMTTTNDTDADFVTSTGYERGEQLGAGGVGTVYKGTQTKLARDVAIKEINEVFNVFAQVKREDIVGRFVDIVREQSSLVHPNVVQIFDVETSVEYPYVVMQYAPKGNLRRLIEMEDRPNLSVALKYFLQILNGLSTAHQAGVVHGNIKPENIVLDAAGNAMLSDFGMSRLVDTEGGRGGQVYVGVGTVAYMAPEQFQNPGAGSIKTDIYAMGIMFYEMLTGKVPGRRSPMPSSFFPDIPRKLDDIFDKMSMDAVEDRYDSIDDILADVYAAEEVMSLLDNRSGVLFFADPIEEGAATVAVPAGEEDSSVGLGESSSSDLDEDSSDVEDDEQADAEEAEPDAESDAEEASEAEESGDDAPDEEADEDSDAPAQDEADHQGEDDDSDDSDDAADGEGNEVLDKLDKYGEMFDE